MVQYLFLIGILCNYFTSSFGVNNSQLLEFGGQSPKAMDKNRFAKYGYTSRNLNYHSKRMVLEAYREEQQKKLAKEQEIKAKEEAAKKEHQRIGQLIEKKIMAHPYKIDCTTRQEFFELEERERTATPEPKEDLAESVWKMEF